VTIDRSHTAGTIPLFNWLLIIWEAIALHFGWQNLESSRAAGSRPRQLIRTQLHLPDNASCDGFNDLMTFDRRVERAHGRNSQTPFS
jgi:hypothetical protein